MSNVLYIYESCEPTNAELFRLLTYAAERAKFQLKKRRCIDISADDLNWCDIILSVRSTSIFESKLSDYSKRLGKRWILMLDDDFLSLGVNYGQDHQGYRDERKRCLKKVLKNTDCLLAVNQKLAEKYVEIGNIHRSILTNTAIDCTSLTSPRASDRKTKIVFYVNDGTRTMFELYLKPIFPRLAEKYEGRISVYFMAVHPDLHEYDDRLDIHYIPHMSFEEFLSYISEQHFDIGLAPLNEDGFSKYKYFNKYIEYTRAGIAGIYSDCALYRQVITDGVNGVLCTNTVDSWLNAIDDLIFNEGKRLQIVENAQQYVRDNLSAEQVATQLIEDIPDFTSYNAPDKKASHIKILLINVSYWAFRARGWVYTIFSCIKSGNFKILLLRIKRKVGRT